MGKPVASSPLRTAARRSGSRRSRRRAGPVKIAAQSRCRFDAGVLDSPLFWRGARRSAARGPSRNGGPISLRIAPSALARADAAASYEPRPGTGPSEPGDDRGRFGAGGRARAPPMPRATRRPGSTAACIGPDTSEPARRLQPARPAAQRQLERRVGRAVIGSSAPGLLRPGAVRGVGALALPACWPGEPWPWRAVLGRRAAAIVPVQPKPGRHCSRGRALPQAGKPRRAAAASARSAAYRLIQQRHPHPRGHTCAASPISPRSAGSPRSAPPTARLGWPPAPATNAPISGSSARSALTPQMKSMGRCAPAGLGRRAVGATSSTQGTPTWKRTGVPGGHR